MVVLTNNYVNEAIAMGGRWRERSPSFICIIIVSTPVIVFRVGSSSQGNRSQSRKEPVITSQRFKIMIRTLLFRWATVVSQK